MFKSSRKCTEIYMSFKQKKFYFPVLVGFLFFLIFLISFSILIFFSYHHNTKIMSSLTSKLTKSVSASVVNKTEIYLKPAILFSQVTSKIVSTGESINLKEEMLRALLIETLRKNSQFSNVYIGIEDGSFLMASQGDLMNAKYIDGKNKKEHIIQVDSEGVQTIIKKDNVSKYDPRGRPWYKGAKKSKGIFWTPPYIFFTSQKKGITVSVPIFRKDNTVAGVIGVDLLLDKLEEFLKTIDISPHTVIAIQSGEHLLSSNVEDEENEFIKAFIHEAHVGAKGMKKDLSFDKNEYVFQQTPLSDLFPESWRYSLIIPKKELIREAVELNKTLIIISFFILGVGLVLIVINAYSISRPLREVSDQLEKISHFELEKLITENSQVEEVFQLQKSLNTMQKTLNSFSHYIPQKVVKSLVERKREDKIEEEDKKK
ncbi:hypothetical protein DID78_03870 [Candidatus Marinamargulisbacteria bacterium SCGC AG-343-D04]|nr:hypothetical protein DID78_03870 [Candidatus Marinamargulisbacteria bacterium SCGC AG-343-D04]